MKKSSIDYKGLFRQLKNTELEPWLASLQIQLDEKLYHSQHGDLAAWEQVLSALPELPAVQAELDEAAVRLFSDKELNADEKAAFSKQLKVLMPWRKGPFDLFGVYIDTEWRSDWKWQRIAPALSPLKGRKVLDVGCGNGYHLWRMAAHDPALLIGVDPGLKYVYQFEVLRRYIQKDNVFLLPFGIEDVPALNAFDTVFSMGVFYHRKSPIDHLFDLRACLVSGGELVLETLVIDGGEGQVLVPEDRYAQMRNVWFLPTVDTLVAWLKRCAYKEIRVVDVSTTTVDEQRATEWMNFHSLAQFLDPEDPTKTIEGYPAPKRVVVIAKAP